MSQFRNDQTREALDAHEFQTDRPGRPPFIAGERLVYQDLVDLICLAGNYPIIGAWMVGGQAVGMGIREDQGPLTGNGSSFVPHLMGISR